MVHKNLGSHKGAENANALIHDYAEKSKPACTHSLKKSQKWLFQRLYFYSVLWGTLCNIAKQLKKKQMRARPWQEKELKSKTSINRDLPLNPELETEPASPESDWSARSLEDLVPAFYLILTCNRLSKPVLLLLVTFCKFSVFCF